ncbi:MAG: hypothetical protein Q9157_001837 [Trypethelium eluteriae]
MSFLTLHILTTLLFALPTLSINRLQHPLLSSPPAPLPLVLWHGLGDNFAADGVNNVLDLASTIHPGTVTYAIRLGDDASSDRSSSYFGNTASQIEAVCDAITSHPVLSKAPAIDALGFSQGGLLLRGMIQRCGDRVKENTWSRFIQGRLVPAQYYRTLNESTGEPTEEYLKYSNLLADVNNERGVKNETYKDHLSRLERFVMYRFEEEDAVIPPESTWLADVWQKPAPDGDEGTDERIVTPLKERKMYEEDWLGLRKLDEKDALEFRTIPGKHMQIGKEVLRDAFKNHFGPLKESKLRDEETVWTVQRLSELSCPLGIRVCVVAVQMGAELKDSAGSGPDSLEDIHGWWGFRPDDY